MAKINFFEIFRMERSRVGLGFFQKVLLLAFEPEVIVQPLPLLYIFSPQWTQNGIAYVL